MFNEDLNEIIITKEDGELIAIIPKDGVITATNDVVVRENYGEPKRYKDVEGKIYVVD